MRNRTFLKKIGQPPGTLLSQEPDRDKTPLSVFLYDSDSFMETTIQATEIGTLDRMKGVLWIDITGTGDSETLQAVGDYFNLSSLTLENIQNGDPRPQINDFTTYSHISLRMLSWREVENSFDSEQIHIILGEGFVLSIQERKGDVFESLRERIRNGTSGRVRKKKADYLAFSLIDAIVDNYLIVCDKLQDRQEFIEENLEDDSPEILLKAIGALKKEMIQLKRSIVPLREVLLTIQKKEIPIITNDTYRFFRDALNNLLLAVDILDHLREILASQHDSLISAISLQMNNVMKILTIMASIFIPLTFVAGVYGMNFKYMPELGYPYAYPLVLLFMGLLLSGMVIYFKRKKWF